MKRARLVFVITGLILMVNSICTVNAAENFVFVGENVRVENFRQFMKMHPNSISRSFVSDIYKGKIMIGMTPIEAKYAGGEFYYKVTPDSAKWPKGSDPFEVMWAQVTRPDNSQIIMIFNNRTQFDTDAKEIFKVYFLHGRVIKIEKNGNEK